jgi:hypothetical protein
VSCYFVFDCLFTDLFEVLPAMEASKTFVPKVIKLLSGSGESLGLQSESSEELEEEDRMMKKRGSKRIWWMW